MHLSRRILASLSRRLRGSATHYAPTPKKAGSIDDLGLPAADAARLKQDIDHRRLTRTAKPGPSGKAH